MNEDTTKHQVEITLEQYHEIINDIEFETANDKKYNFLLHYDDIDNDFILTPNPNGRYIHAIQDGDTLTAKKALNFLYAAPADPRGTSISIATQGEVTRVLDCTNITIDNYRPLLDKS